MLYTIYAIQNKVNKKIYIGRSQNVYTRIQSHMRNLRKGTHIIEDMQNDFNKYGDVFDYFILETEIQPADKISEYRFIKKYKSYLREYGYNYKDHLAKKIIFGKPKIEFKTAEELLKNDTSEKGKYITEIIEILNKTNDLVTLDIVYKTLIKSQHLNKP